jgi:hypothetical protein
LWTENGESCVVSSETAVFAKDKSRGWLTSNG